jgi:hypothetical protein
MSSYLEYLKAHPVSIEPGQPVEVVPFHPRYAEAFARCYYEVYRDTFPMPYVYEPEQIVAAVNAAELLSVLAVTPRGEVVGLTSAFHFGPNRRAWEIGGTMVIEAYRKGNLARPLMDRIWAECQASSADTIYCSAVCNHIYTQYSGRQSGLRPAALDLDGFTNFDGDQAIETSLLFLFMMGNRTPCAVHLPTRYTEIAQELYRNLQIERTIHSLDQAPTLPTGLIKTQPLSRALRLTVDTIAADLPAAVAAAIGAHPQCHTVQICLPLEQAAAPWAAERLREAGYFFSGILPLWGVSDHLVLQRVSRPQRFEKVVLCDAFAKRLLAFIRDDHAALGSTQSQDTLVA